MRLTYFSNQWTFYIEYRIVMEDPPWRMILTGLPLLATILKFLLSFILGPFYTKNRIARYYS